MDQGSPNTTDPEDVERDSHSQPPPQCQRHPNNPSASPAPLSKNAIKKAIRAERYATLKLERRAREKERKKQKKRLKVLEKEKARELGVDEDEVDEEGAERGKKRARTDDNQSKGKGKVIQFGGRVVVDLGFDDLMNEKEIVSLTSQLAYTYSLNRRASFPFSLLFTSLSGRTFTRLETLKDYKRWTNTVWWEEGYERLWSGEMDSEKAGEQSSDYKKDEQLENIVYLTADSDEELLELKPHETYIIGGIVDHNRYKNLCLNKAKSDSVRTARLPIGRYLASMQTRKVLTVNQVFDVMLKWVETNDWEKALHAVVPKRKFQHADQVTAGELVAELEGVEEPQGDTLVVETTETSNCQEVEEAHTTALEVNSNLKV